MRLDLEQDVLEGQTGVELDEVFRLDRIAGARQQFGVDAGGDDFGIDQHAVEIENDEFRLGHGFPGNLRRHMAGDCGCLIARCGAKGKFGSGFIKYLREKVTITRCKQ
jgi:hypothetical protein